MSEPEMNEPGMGEPVRAKVFAWAYGACAVAIVAGATTLIAACGAGVSRTYESDVRFERCFALDWKEDIDHRIRSRCWEEWLTYYVAGQPKDRIEYAKKQLDDGESNPKTTLAVPAPTSVFEPVPMMVTATASASESAPPPPPPPPPSPCELKADAMLEGCLRGCGGSSCAEICTKKHTQLVQRCGKQAEPRASGSPASSKPR